MLDLPSLLFQQQILYLERLNHPFLTFLTIQVFLTYCQLRSEHRVYEEKRAHFSLFCFWLLNSEMHYSNVKIILVTLTFFSILWNAQSEPLLLNRDCLLLTWRELLSAALRTETGQRLELPKGLQGEKVLGMHPAPSPRRAWPKGEPLWACSARPPGPGVGKRQSLNCCFRATSRPYTPETELHRNRFFRHLKGTVRFH